jgi:hypothetical protein
MADHLHKAFNLNVGDVVEVNSDTQANVMLLSDADYASYKARRSYRAYGHFFTHFPARLSPPHSGHWHVVLDLAGGKATVKHSIGVIKAGA